MTSAGGTVNGVPIRGTQAPTSTNRFRLSGSGNDPFDATHLHSAQAIARA